MSSYLAIGRARCLSFGVALLAVLCSPASTQDQPKGFDREHQVEQLVERIELFAEWCRKERLLAERDAAFEMLLHFVPDHKDGRRVLKFKKKRGVWEQSSSYKPRKNKSTAKLDECGDRRREVVDPYREWIAAGLDVVADSSTARDVLIADLMAIAPNDPKAREMLGQAWHPVLERWVMAESARGAQRRGEIEDAVHRIVGAIDPVEARLRKLEAELEVPWTSAFVTEHVRVVGTGTRDEIATAARYAEAAVQLLVETSGCRAEVQPFVLYLLDEREHRDGLLRSHSGVDEKITAEANHCTGAWIPNTDQVALWGRPCADRLQRVVEQGVAWGLSAGLRVEADDGWAWEGMRMYVASLLLGPESRLQDYAGTRWSNQDARGPDVTGDGGWIDVVDVLLGGGQSSIAHLMALPSHEMGNKERLCSFALVRFLVECHPSDAYGVLRDLDRNSAPERVLAEAVGASLPELTRRVLAWAEQTAEVIEIAPAFEAPIAAVAE